MPTKKMMALLGATLSILFVAAQKNFQYTPEHPKAGEVITIIYEPAGTIAGTTKPVEAAYYTIGGKNAVADDIKLTRNGNQYTGTVKTDTANTLVYFGFSSDDKFDNNFNEGYYILLNEGDKEKKGAYNNLSMFYQYFGQNVGVERNTDKALEALQKEMSLYPDDRKTYLVSYLRLTSAAKKADANITIEKEIENLLKAGLKKEDDYSLLQNLYNIAKLPEQAKLVAEIEKEKYPQGKWTVNETMQKFFMEQDPAKAESLYAGIVQKAKTDSNWKEVQPYVDNFKQQIPFKYAQKKDWEGLKKYMSNNTIKDAGQLASIYNNVAWEIQGSSGDLKQAEELSRFATQYAKKEMTHPTAPKPSNLTTKQWEKARKGSYAMYADTYAMVMYKMGKYKEGFPYAQDAAIKIGEGKDAAENNTYALLAEKVLPEKKYKKELEEFIKNGKATADTKEILKRAYVKEKGNDTGFDDYTAALQKENYTKSLADLRKSMLNQAAPSFALLDLDGNKVNVSDLKGKVLVVDFWATWCGPCKASFPGMQKLQNKYKDNPDVKFVFIDTWERVDDKKKNAADFITDKKYNFHVLLDEDSKVVDQFNVEGIPTKFIIDKNGIIRFKSVGFDGSDDKLIDELTAMIEIASADTKKAF